MSDASAQVISAIKERGGSVKCVYRTPLLLREHLRPDKFDMQLRDPVPPAHALKQLDRISARGAEVVFNMPKWLSEQQSKQQEAKPEEA